MNMVVLVPARGGSKRVEGKNGRILGGKELWRWSVEIGLEMGLRTYLSTEVEEWGRRGEEIGCGWIRRPEELRGDGVRDYEVIEHVLGEIGGGIDLLVYLRPTTPLRDSAVIKQAIGIMKKEPVASLRSVELMVESAFKCFTRGPDGLLAPIESEGCDVTDWPSQKVIETYRANGYVDIIRPVLMFYGNMWGYNRYGFVTPRSIEIDTEEDWEYAVWHERRLSARDKVLEQLH